MKYTSDFAIAPEEDISILTPERTNLLPPNVQRVMELRAQHKLFSPKYWTMQKNGVLRDVHRLYSESPALPVKQVVLTILTDLPDFLPSWNVRNVVGFITEEWKTLSQADEAAEVPAS